jgi:hypothetical protein
MFLIKFKGAANSLCDVSGKLIWKSLGFTLTAESAKPIKVT